MLAVLILLIFSALGQQTCYTGSYNFFTSTTGSAITSGVCTGVCQLAVGTSNDVVQTASCETAASCAANQLLAFPDGTTHSAVACCTTDDCNDPRRGFPSTTNCTEKTSESLCSQSINCGWCFTTSTCEAGNPNGPLTGTCTTWDYKWSQATTNAEGTGLDVYLRPGVPLDATFTSGGGDWDQLNLLILVDNSLSSQAVVSGVNAALVGLSRSLLQTYTKPVKFSVATYHDIQIYTQSTSPLNYLFQSESKFSFVTLAASQALQDIAYLEATGLGAETTAALSSLMYSANGPEIDWTDNAFRVALVVSANPFHIEGDGAQLGIYVPNNNDGVLDAFPGQPAGSGEDYPGYSGLAQVLLANGVYPIFGVADSALLPSYNAAVTALGFGSAIDLSPANSGGNITTVLIDTITTVLATTSQLYYGDVDSGFVVDVAGSTYTFYASTSRPDLGSAPVQVGVRDFASPVPFSFLVTTVPPIRGCDGVFGSGKVVDKCGACGGANACLGCSGTISNDVFDLCGVCAGDNTSCVGCDGVIGSGLVFDVCGACGGDGTSCVGCDGVVNSGKDYSYCGICGLGIACASSFHPLGIAGIVLICVGVFALCAMCIGVLAGKRSLTHKRQALKKDQLFIEAQQRHKLTKRKSSAKVTGQMQASSVA